MGYIALIAAIFCGELYIKNSIVENESEEVNKPLLQGNIILRRFYNKGAFMNLGANNRRVMAVISVIFTLLLSGVFLLTLTARGNHILKAGLAILLGGAFSNTYDRLKRKYVVDYFSFGKGPDFLRKIVFNISDFLILLGSMLMVVWEITRS